MKDSCFYPWCVYTNEGHSTLGRRVGKIYLFICDDVSSSWMGDKWENQAKQQWREKIHQQPILICLAVLRGNLIRILFYSSTGICIDILKDPFVLTQPWQNFWVFNLRFKVICEYTILAMTTKTVFP